jgi:hypothetical protein
VPIDSEDSEIVVDRKTKITLFGLLLIMGGVGCFFVFLFSYWVNANRISSPTSTTKGTVTSYTPGVSRNGTDRQSATCIITYQVEGKTYPRVDTCGADIFLFGERLGDEVEIIYQMTDPSKSYVNRNSFFNFVAILGFPLLIFGWLLMRKGMRMPVEDNQD